MMLHSGSASWPQRLHTAHGQADPAPFYIDRQRLDAHRLPHPNNLVRVFDIPIGQFTTSLGPVPDPASVQGVIGTAIPHSSPYTSIQ